MLRLPPRSTRTDTRFPYTPRFLSQVDAAPLEFGGARDIIVGQRKGRGERRARCAAYLGNCVHNVFVVAAALAVADQGGAGKMVGHHSCLRANAEKVARYMMY